MAKLNIIPLNDREVQRTDAAMLRAEYLKLAKGYTSVSTRKNLYCHGCDEFLDSLNFYKDGRFASRVFPICKDCLAKMASDVVSKSGELRDNAEKARATAEFMDIPFIKSVYEGTSEFLTDDQRAKSKWVRMVTVVRNNKAYSGMTYRDSILSDKTVSSSDGEDIPYEDVRVARQEIKRLFGPGFEEGDYLYLQDQYDDWCARTAVDTKAQQLYVVRICFKLLDILKAQREGKDTKALDSSLNELMAAANLQPKQNVTSAASDSLTFGQLIEKWETEKPIPEPDEEFKDVNNIGKLIRVYFAGHLSKALGLKNSYSEEYEKEIERYTVRKPEEREDVTSDVYQEIFGKDEG